MPQKVYGQANSVEDLVDASEVGKDILKALTASDVRIEISAAGTTHTHEVADVNGLSTSLDTKASLTHQHNASDLVAGTLDAARVPTLPQSKVTNLTTDLSAKVSNASGTTMRIRGYGISLPTEGNQTGDVWFVQG